MTHFIDSVNFKNENHRITLFRIVREDEASYFVRPLVRDNFIRLPDRVVLGQYEQHSHFKDELEDIEVFGEMKINKNNWTNTILRIDDLDDAYFIHKQQMKGYNTNMFSMNLKIYEMMAEIQHLYLSINKNKENIRNSEMLKQSDNFREIDLYNINHKLKKIENLKKGISKL